MIGAYVNSESWVIMSAIEQQIRDKILSIGVPLDKWGVSINYGIKTGYNDAFIISAQKREGLIAADPKSADIIRPYIHRSL